MNFLNPLYLLAALAALVPLIIHLLHRQRARIEVFPSLEFLRRMMRRKTRRFHLKQILLLIARILLLLFIALALARPTLTGGRAVSGHLPTTAVVILDDSYSMQRVDDRSRLFDEAVGKTLDLLDYLERSDEVHVLTASRPSRELTAPGVTDLDGLRTVLGEVECTNRATDIASPLRQALTILQASSKPNREIYIISDMQKPGWEGLEETLDAGDLDIKVLAVDLGAEDANACVDDIAFRIPAGTDNLVMQVAFKRYNSDSPQGRVAEVFLRDTMLDRAVFSGGEASMATATFSLPPVEGFLWGEVAMAEDRLAVDDRRYYAVPSRKRSVGVLGEAYYVKTALSPEGGGGFTWTGMEEGAVNRASLAAVDVLVVSDIPRFSPLEVDAISDFVLAGGGLLIFLGGSVDIGAYNHNLLPRLGDIRIEGTSPAGGTGFYTIDRYEEGHRIFDKFKPGTNPFSDARFYQFIKVREGAGQAIAYFSDGSPAIVEVSDHVIVVTTPPEVGWNDLALTSQFLPLLHETLLYLTSKARLGRSYDLGEEILIPNTPAEGEVVLEGPTGVVRHFPEAGTGSMGFPIPSPEQPGIYFLKTDKETLSVFALNVDTSESDLTKIGIEQVQARLRGFDIRQASQVGDIGESVSMLRQGRDLARMFLWAALVLVVLETLLASSLWQKLRSTSEDDAFANS
jgi:hypothetical protein